MTTDAFSCSREDVADFPSFHPFTRRFAVAQYSVGFTVPNTPEVRKALHEMKCAMARRKWKLNYGMERMLKRNLDSAVAHGR